MLEYEMMLFFEEDNKVKQLPARKFSQHSVFTKDITKLTDEIIARRSLNHDDVFIRVGLDGGGGFLKICLSVFEINNLTSCTSAVEKKYLDSGVKKVQIVAIAPDVPENYLNMKKLWIRSGIHNMKYKFTIATDMKLINILL